MKKILSVLLCIIMSAMIFIPLSSSANDDTVNIHMIDEYTANDNGIIWNYSPSTYTITVSGNGSIPDRTTAAALTGGPMPTWCIWFGQKIENVIIKDGITGLGKNAFAACYGLKNVILPDTLEYIGENAFDDCDQLKEITLPASVKRIDSCAFGLYRVYTDGTEIQPNIKVTFLGSAPEIDKKAFFLTDAICYYPENDPTWTDDILIDYNGLGDPPYYGKVIWKSWEPSDKNNVVYKFTDIEKGQWYVGGIQYVYDNTYMTGTSSDKFAPNTDLTRAQFVQILAKFAEAELAEVEYKNIFSDVPDGQWYTKAVIWAYENGYAAGIGDGKFEPDQPITREQLAVFICNYGNKNDIYFPAPDLYNTGDNFDDSTEISAWAKGQVRTLACAGIISGTDKKHISPKMTATRAQTALIIENFLELCPDKADVCRVEVTQGSFVLTSASGKVLNFDNMLDVSGDMPLYYRNIINSGANVELYVEKSESFTVTTECENFTIGFAALKTDGEKKPTLTLTASHATKITLNDNCEFSFEGNGFCEFSLRSYLPTDDAEKELHWIDASGHTTTALNGKVTADSIECEWAKDDSGAEETHSLELEYNISSYGDEPYKNSYSTVKKTDTYKLNVPFADIIK